MGIRHLISRTYHRLKHSLRFYFNETSLQEFVPRGHYYSPLPNIEQTNQFLEKAASQDRMAGLPGINLRARDQRQLVKKIIDITSEFDWPVVKTDDRRYYTSQEWFNISDGIVLYSMLRLSLPKLVIEVGFGYSSSLMIDAREFKLKTDTKFIFIDPHPEKIQMFIKADDLTAVTLLSKRVQEISPEVFDALSQGDILFIDSSHVSKAGSDLNHIIFNVLPKLAPGVLVHFHDVFWPFEYPVELVKRGVAWNEAYLLRVFLMFNCDFEIVLWPAYIGALDRASADASLSKFRLHEGQSIWIRRALPREIA